MAEKTVSLRRCSGITAFVISLCLMIGTAPAQEKDPGIKGPLSAISFEGPAVWVAVVKADNQGTTTDPRLLSINSSLDEIFGYKAYHVIQQDYVPLVQKWEHWVIPRDEYYMKVKPFEDRPDGSTRVQLELYRGKKFLTQQRYDFKDDFKRPLLINGPAYQDGHLHYVIMLVPKTPDEYAQEKMDLYRQQREGN